MNASFKELQHYESDKHMYKYVQSMNFKGIIYQTLDSSTSFDLNTMLIEDIRRIVISILKLFTGEEAVSIHIGKILKCPV